MSPDTNGSPSSDLTFAASYAGFVGSGVLAVFFLLRDSVIGAPLLTPSILGSGLFGAGVDPDTAIRLDWVALVSLVHVSLFTAAGGLFAVLAHRSEALRGNPVLLGVGLFAALEIGALVLDAIAAPGLVAALGPVWVMAGNAVAASAMTIFYGYAFGDAPIPVEVRTRG